MEISKIKKTILNKLLIPSFIVLSLSTPCDNGGKLENLILSNSLNNQTIMFGEYHGDYRADNDFVIKILPRLKKQGFNYLALEIDRNPKSNSNEEIITNYALGKITRKDIPQYIINLEKEIAFGLFDLIDAARKTKMKIICYDARDGQYESFNEREAIAFKNLKELIFDKEPDAKVIVYSGGKHLNEKPLYDPELYFWERLYGLSNPNQENENYFRLGYHLDKYTKNKNLTIKFTLGKKSSFYGDINIDLKGKTYYYKKE